MAFSAAQSVRDALQTWAQSLVADLLPQATVEGGPAEAGQAPALPTLSLDWGATRTERVRPTDGVESLRGVWLLQYEDVDLAFIWRATSLEDADLFAHEFAARAALAALRSNDEGNRVLHFDVTLGDLTRTAKLYLGGEVVPVQPAENVTRSLYTYRVPGSVAYPVYFAEPDSDPTGLMNVIVIINGTSYPLAQFEVP